MTTQGLSIVIPQYSQEVVSLLDRLETCIPNHLVYEFIVANDNDNASYPQTKEWLTKRGFHYLQNPKNIGKLMTDLKTSEVMIFEACTSSYYG